MPDDTDQAQELAAQNQDRALAAWHDKQPPQGLSATECADCGEPIPEARRKAKPGCTLCIDCQRHAEWMEGRR